MTALRKPSPDEDIVVDRIVAAINALDESALVGLGAWQALTELSSRTEFEAIDSNEASVVLNGDRFEAIAEVYVLLNYGAGDEETSLSDSYVATIRGTAGMDRISIDQVTIDTSPFYS